MTELQTKPVRVTSPHRGRMTHQAQMRTGARRQSIVIFIFLISLLIPIYFFAGSVRFSPYLIVLLTLFIPSAASVYSGQLGKVTSSDILFVLFCFVASISLLNSPHGSVVQQIGVINLETLGSYLIARTYIRSPDQFRGCIRMISAFIIILTPFAAYESFTGHHIILDSLAGLFYVVPSVNIDPRFGLHRAQVILDHPILFGVYCATGFALTFFVFNRRSSFIRSLSIVPSVFFSLSSAALLMLVIQFFLIMWELFTRGIRYRFRILAATSLAFYFGIDVLSHRTPFEVFGSYLTFNQETSYARIAIWNYGIQSVVDHPLLGIGLNEWNPHWMSPSLDNFWLLLAVRHGIPALAFFSAAILLICFRLGRFKTDDAYLGDCRKGLLITLTSLIIVACTVHFWNATYCFFMFLLGSGEWMEDWGRQSASPSQKKIRPLRYVRSARELAIVSGQARAGNVTAGIDG